MKVLLCIIINSFFLCNIAVSQENSLVNRFSIACHNCYDPQFAINIEDVLPFTTSIEVDIWDSDIYSGAITTLFGGKRMDRDWYVKHTAFQEGNRNCCGGTFKDCLTRINNWSIQNPNHDLITIFIDKKENWSNSNETRKPSDLDQLLLSIFSQDRVFTPSNLLKKNASLKEAALNGNWPSLYELKGKVIFVITDATMLLSRNPLEEYLNLRNESAVCFVAPEISTASQITQPLGLSNENSKNVVFYNLKYPNKSLANNIHHFKCLSRVYGAPEPETKEAFQDMRNNKVNYIALFNFRLNELNKIVK
jgi:hypothetical protein